MKHKKKIAFILAGTLMCTTLLQTTSMANSSLPIPITQSTETTPSQIDLKDLFRFSGNAIQINNNTAQLTDSRILQKGAISGKVGLDLSKDFSLDMDVNLGNDSNGADGVGIAFHKGEIGQIGNYGGGLGIQGLPQGFGFELDTFSGAPDDEDESFGHNQMRGAHAGFVSTDSNILRAMAPMKSIEFEADTFKNLQLKWNASENKLTASYDGSQWEVTPDIDTSSRYTFVIASSTGDRVNTHTVRINDFTGEFTKPELTANNISIEQNSTFDPFDPMINLRAIDEVDGDITDKIKVISNNVDTSQPGTYEVTYEVTNSQGESDTKTITITVFKPTWPEGSPNGWKAFAGQNVNLLKDADKALFGEYVYYSQQQSAIYKEFQGEETFHPGKYRVTVYAKGDNDVPPTLPLKVSLKKTPSSTESRTLLLANSLSSGEQVEKGYYKVSSEVILASDERTPLITVENYQAGYIAGIFIDPIT